MIALIIILFYKKRLRFDKNFNFPTIFLFLYFGQ